MLKTGRLFPAVCLVLAIFLVGCQPTLTGQAPDENSAAEIAAAHVQIADLKSKLANSEQMLQDSNQLTDSLKKQLADFAAATELAGATPAETAANIIRIYHQTHSYSKTDLFVCGDMSSDVWNQLQAQGIRAWIRIGSIDNAITEMQNSDHAWVMAEVGPNTLLALETTNGQVVQRSEQPRYYGGWSFDNPAEFKRFEELKYEHNLRVALYNDLVAKSQQVYTDYQTELNKYNNQYSSNPGVPEALEQLSTVMELQGRFEQLQDALDEQANALDAIVPEMTALAS